MVLPPLPAGWTEHTGPGGQLYYHNSVTRESTYTRPLPPFPGVAVSEAQKQRRREKPLIKTPIPGTDWLRIKTTGGNIFYSNKTNKQSVWIVPEEIKVALVALEKEEKERAELPLNVSKAREEEKKLNAEKEQIVEDERIKSDIKASVKRNVEEVEPVEEIVISKKSKVEEEEMSEDSNDGEGEEWQKQVATQLMAEAEAEKQQEKTHVIVEEKKLKEFNMPERVDLSTEEAKALFKNLLREKDISPLHPWDTSLPLFVNDPRYVLLPSVSARREAFDEYCRDRARESRRFDLKGQKTEASPKETFERLLSEEITSTRLTWGEFRKTWRKDRRFWGYGRDDREREKRFRVYIKELGERKRAAVQKAEADFFRLLKEYHVGEGSIWKEVKRAMCHDSRYDAVGSSSLREELFNNYVKAGHTKERPLSQSIATPQSAGHDDLMDLDQTELEGRKKARRERAVKERETKVKAQLGKVEAEIGRSKMGLSKEEGEREFMSLLTDAVRDPLASWDVIVPQLMTDPRFRKSPLGLNRQLHLFHNHVERLSSKCFRQVHELFEEHAPSLATNFNSLPLASLLSAPSVTKLGMNVDRIEGEFNRWQRIRTQEARKAFDQMLSENSFVEFWGRLGKIGGEGVDGGVGIDDLGEDEGEGAGGKVDMKELARHVDIEDMKKVLRNDKRYIVFDHIPDQREHWIRDYLSSLSAPTLSVHVPSATKA